MQALIRSLPSLARLAIVVSLGACASSAKLAKQSDEALLKGDLRKAYDRALSAVEKDPRNQPARASYRTASMHVAADYRTRVTAKAAGDTIAGADLALDYQKFRTEVSRHETPLDPAPDYDRAEALILRGAARIYYRRGVEAMGVNRPRLAVEDFSAVQRYDERFEDVARRLSDARVAATARIALLPFNDRIGVPGLSQDIGDTTQKELYRRAGSEFRYTEIISGDDIERKMTVAEQRSLTPADAVPLGRRLGATQVVIGRFRDLRSTQSQRISRFPMFHRVDRRDSAGVTTQRWDEFMLPVTTRQRDVNVIFDFNVIDVATGVVLVHREQPVQTVSRTAWTDFTAEQPYDRYSLLPPDARRADPKRAKTADDAWRAEMGTWDVKDLMRNSRDQRGRQRYAPRYRTDFYGNTRETPAWLGELPSENELVFVALHDVWREVLSALKELDSKN